MQTQETKISPSEEQYGFGTAQPVEAFCKSIVDSKNTQTVLLAVNIATMLRNAIGTVAFIEGKKFENKEAKTFNVTSVIANVRSTMVEIANEVAAICAAKYGKWQHHLVFYLTDTLKQIPPQWLRSRDNETSRKVDLLTSTFLKSVKPFDETNGNTSLHLRLASQMRVPSYKGLTEVLTNFARHDVDLHLISHLPLDYHIASYSGRKCTLYRSHTGEIVQMTPSNLGKIVFKSPDVPFYPATHILFGDKYLIKGTLPKKERDRLMDIAKVNRWGIRTNDYVVTKIKENNFPLPYSLS